MLTGLDGKFCAEACTAQNVPITTSARMPQCRNFICVSSCVLDALVSAFLQYVFGAAASANVADMRLEPGRNGNTVPQAFLARKRLRVARHQPRFVGIRARRLVQHIDDVVQIVLELSLVAEKARIQGEEKMADIVGIARLLAAVADRRKRAAGER